MLSLWLKKMVLAAALAVMPLQGVAATLSVLLCHGDAQMHAVHDPGNHDHGSHHDGHHSSHQDDGGSTGNPAFHLCCHYTISAPAIVTLPVAIPDFPVRAFAPDSLRDLFFPDQPQRPPLA